MGKFRKYFSFPQLVTCKLHHKNGREAGDELFISKQISKISGDVIYIDRKQVLRESVEKRKKIFDGVFLSALNAYIVASRVIKAEEALEVILELKEIVLESIRGEMHFLIPFVEETLTYPRRAKRLAKLESFLLDSNKKIKPITANLPDPDQWNQPILQLYLITNQLLEDMESLEIIPDIKLLAKIVILREELRLIERNTGTKEEYRSKYIYQHVPSVEMAFLKELMRVDDCTKRKNIIKTAISGDNLAINEISSSTTDFTEILKHKKREGTKAKLSETVRPGRLMDSLSVMKEQLTLEDSKNQARINRIMDIWFESNKSLEEIAFGNLRSL